MAIEAGVGERETCSAMMGWERVGIMEYVMMMPLVVKGEGGEEERCTSDDYYCKGSNEAVDLHGSL